MKRTPFRALGLLVAAGVISLLPAGRGLAQATPPLALVEQAGLVAVTLDEQQVGSAAISPRTGKKVTQRVSQVFARLLQDAAGRRLGRSARNSRALRVVTQAFDGLLGRQNAGASGRVSAQALSGPIGVTAVVGAFTTGGLALDEALDAGFNVDGVDYTGALTNRQTVTASGVTIQVDSTPVPTTIPEDGALFAALLRLPAQPNAGLLVCAVFDGALQARLEDNGVVNATVSNVDVTIPFDLSLSEAKGSVHGTIGEPSFANKYFAKTDVIGLGVPPAAVSGIQSFVNGLRADGS